MKRIQGKTLLLALSAVLLPASSCGFLRRHRGEIQQAVWVTRFDYQTEENVRQVVRNCAAYGFDTILFQVRGHATVSYRSRIEPWSEVYRFEDPGFDPLAVACDEARRNGIALHAWINALPGWRGAKAPASERQIFHRRPEWFLYDQDRKRQSLRAGHYVWLNPCLPEVRTYIAGICEEIAWRYPVDGIHLDYIRMPHGIELGPDEKIDYPRDERTLEIYRLATGKSPDEDRDAWWQWKTRQVSELVREIRSRVRGARGRVLLSAAVYKTPATAIDRVNQDWSTWLAKGHVDLVFPMQYHVDDDQFKSDVLACVEAAGHRSVVIGIGAFQHEPEQTVRQMDLVDELGGQGYSLFAYSSFFPSTNRGVDDPPAVRRARRERVLSKVQTRSIER